MVKDYTGYPLHRENRGNGKNKYLSGKTGNLEILPKHRENTGNLVCSSCQFPDFKGKRYFEICHKNLLFFLSLISLPSQFCVCYSHKSRKLAQGKFAVGQGKNRENIGNFKMQFEWVL